tara:strand:- start:59 stop:181 length:123 start_codon:yes stop_codon:yes gene_type:complete
MSVFRNKAALLAVLVTAGLGACQMTSLSAEDQKIFQDTDK